MKILDIATLINPELTSLDTLHQRYQWGNVTKKSSADF